MDFNAIPLAHFLKQLKKVLMVAVVFEDGLPLDPPSGHMVPPVLDINS